MASNTNSQQKGKSANEPDKKLSVQSEAADVDWMIMTDISTRIGGSSQPKPNSVSQSPQNSIDQAAEDDLEDLDWLQSLGLDEAIDRSPAPKNTAAESNGDVENIDWLIMTDIQAKIDDSDIKSKVNPSYPDISLSKTTFQPSVPEAYSLDVGLDEALELDNALGLDGGLDFLEDPDFSDLGSLDFDTFQSLNQSLNQSLSIDELENAIDNTEGKIEGLAEMLDDGDDSSFDLSNDGSDQDWNSISGVLDGDTNEVLIDQPSFDIVNEDVDGIVSDFQDFAFSNELEKAVENEFQSESQNEFERDLQSESQNNLDISQDMSFEAEDNNLEVSDKALDNEFNDEFNDEFEAVQPLETSSLSMTEDEIWASKSSNLEPKITDAILDDAFTSDWGNNAESAIAIDDAVWDSTPNIDSVSSTAIDNAFGSFDDWESLPEAAQEVNEVNINDNNSDLNWDIEPNDLAIANNGLESVLDENFDLASFDENSLPEIPLSEPNIDIIPTMLTPVRVAAIPHSEPAFTPDLTPTPPPIINYADNSNRLEEDAPANDSLNMQVNASNKVDLYEESFANTGDRDFLDDFELDNFELDNFEQPINAIADRDIDSGFTPPPAIAQITPPAPKPPSFPPIPKQEPTAPSLNNPPPFLPPLPPKRNLAKPIPPKAPTNPIVNTGSQSQPQRGIGNKKDDFEQFHEQLDRNKNRPPIHSIEEEWSDLLDSDTVLSVGRSSTGLPYPEPSVTKPPSTGLTAGRASQGRDNRSSSGIPKRKETDLPDFNDLGLEVHDDNADWSGLLDSSDMSDNITTVSNQITRPPARTNSNPTNNSRSEMTSTSETKEIPRNRRQPAPNLAATNQSPMGATPDQVDFNRFTEDSYDTYDEHIKSVELSSKTPSKPKITMPSVSLESLWQDYLKIPAIGLGVIGGGFLLYSLLNKPVFDMGLKLGLFKDARGRDYTNADFKGAKLDNVDFSDAILTGAKMQDASLVGANFQKANLDGVNFTNANLSKARLIQASVVWAEFNKAQMSLTDLQGADLTLSNFANAKMEGANLLRSKIGAQGTSKATKFSAPILLAWQIVNEPREGRNLAGQDLSGLNLSFTSLKRANLSNTKLNYTDLTGTDLRGANLTGSQINGTNWSGAKLNGMNLTGVVFDKNKIPKTDEETVCPNGKKGVCNF